MKEIAMRRNKPLSLLVWLLLSIFSHPSLAASGEMGSGKPSFGVYTTSTSVFFLKDATVAFPSGCYGGVVLSPATMGIETYRIALSILITAKATNTAVRFYAHAERDGGCGVDYVQPL
jgi:hypothetical protein